MEVNTTKMKSQAEIDAIIRFAVNSDVHRDSFCDAVPLACAMLRSSDDDAPAKDAAKPQPSRRKPELSLT
jgi:hypothetical protein